MADIRELGAAHSFQEYKLDTYDMLNQQQPCTAPDMIVSAVKAGGTALVDAQGIAHVGWRTVQGGWMCLPEDYQALQTGITDLELPPEDCSTRFDLTQADPEFAAALGLTVHPETGELQFGEYTYRMAQAADYLAVDKIMRDTFAMEGPNHALYDLMKYAGGHVGGVYDAEGLMVAFTTVIPTYDDSDGTPGYLLDMIGVSPDTQLAGLGKKTIQSIALVAQSQGIERIELTFDPVNPRLAHLYTSCGFQPTYFYPALYGEGYDRFGARLDLGHPILRERLVFGREKSMMTEQTVGFLPRDLAAVQAVQDNINAGQLQIIDYDRTTEQYITQFNG